MTKQKIIKIISTLIVVVTIALGVCIYKLISTDNQLKVSDGGKVISYYGKDGKTALDLLEQGGEAVIAGSGINAHVASINGITADLQTQYWEFMVNGKAATTSASNYVTKSSDVITWELASF